MSAPGEPYICPACGGDEWKADYYEAVWQSISLFTGEDGEPEFGDYTGITDHYDDGSTVDEAWRCRNCEHEIKLGEFRMLTRELDTTIIASLGLAAFHYADPVRQIEALKVFGAWSEEWEKNLYEVRERKGGD